MPSTTKTEEPSITIGGVEASEEVVRRLSILLWGQAGVGKTTLASTMPGKIALINFDPDGPSSIPDAEHVKVFDLSGTGDEIARQFKTHDPLGITDALEHFDSIIVDSLTSMGDRALGLGIGITKGATIERPSPGAYGARNNLINTFIRHVLTITARGDKHVCFIAHEGGQGSTDEGILTEITLALGGQLPANVALKLNECWNLFEDGKGRKMLLVRKGRNRTPLKSRMFDTMDEYEFEWWFNTRDRNDPTNMTIEGWFEQWKANEFRKIDLPTRPKPKSK